MKYFNVTEALQYLNKLAPDAAPKNEETLRRAIRSGELIAKVNRGREGSQIAEHDLVAYGRKYIAKQHLRSGNMQMQFASAEEVSKLMLPSSISEILQNALRSGEKPEETRIKIFENKRKWEEHAAELKLKIQKLENDLNVCESEISAMNIELSKS